MNRVQVWIAVGTVFVVLTLLQLGVIRFEKIHDDFIEQSKQSQQSLEDARVQSLQSLRDAVLGELTVSARALSDEQVRLLEERLQKLTIEVSNREVQLKKIEQLRDRIDRGLPELVELDQLGRDYSVRLKGAGYYGAIDTFNTSLGPITFARNDFTLAYIPSSHRLAWLKIGKRDSGDNSKLIKSWLDEAESAKLRLGYIRVYRTTNPSDYGEYTETLYRKGDMYFKTYFQHQRVQGTYDRHSLQYTFYVETGSDSRRQQYELEQYNQKLGS